MPPRGAACLTPASARCPAQPIGGEVRRADPPGRLNPRPAAPRAAPGRYEP